MKNKYSEYITFIVILSIVRIHRLIIKNSKWFELKFKGYLGVSSMVALHNISVVYYDNGSMVSTLTL